MLEAYLFATGEGSSPQEALQAALRWTGGKSAWVEELVWLGVPAPGLDPPKPALSLPEEPGLDHFSLNACLRLLLTGERQMLALGQTRAEHSMVLLLGAPAVVGLRNLLPLARLHPSPLLPAGPAALEESLRDFVLSLAERPAPPEPSAEAQPLIISPAMPPPAPLPPLKIPDISLLAQMGAASAVLPGARRLEPAPGALSALAGLTRALARERLDWGGLLSGLETACLLTLVERI